MKVTTKMIPKSVGGWEMTLQDDAGLWISHTLQKSHNRPPYAAFLSPSQYLTPVLLVVENDIS